MDHVSTPGEAWETARVGVKSVLLRTDQLWIG